MALKSFARFTIDVLDKPRSLFSVQEDPETGNMLLGLRAPYPEGDHPVDPDYVDTRPLIREHRFSIHPSPTSPESVNVIKHTRLLQRGDPIVYRNYTKAIKNGDRFAVVFCRRCPDLLLPSFIPKNKSPNEVSLGRLDPKDFTLAYVVLVGAKKLEYTFPPDPVFESMNVTYLECKNLRITVLWAFTNIPAHNSFSTRYFTTVPPTNEEDEERMLGLNALYCGGHFGMLFVKFTDELLERLRLERDIETANHFRRYLGYFKTGLPSDPGYRRHMTQMVRQEIHRRLIEDIQNRPR